MCKSCAFADTCASDWFSLTLVVWCAVSSLYRLMFSLSIEIRAHCTKLCPIVCSHDMCSVWMFEICPPGSCAFLVLWCYCPCQAIFGSWPCDVYFSGSPFIRDLLYNDMIHIAIVVYAPSSTARIQQSWNALMAIAAVFETPTTSSG